MARTMVQFQKGLSEPEFERVHGTQERCRSIAVASRQHKGRHRRNLPAHQRQARPPLPRRVRMPLRSRRHASPPVPGWSANPVHALSAAEIG